MVVGGYRHGGRGYYALDITQPDHLDEETIDTRSSGGTRIAFVPDRGANCAGTAPNDRCVPSCNQIDGGSALHAAGVRAEPVPVAALGVHRRLCR